MKNYKQHMEQLCIRDEFCEETLKKAQSRAEATKKIPRALTVAACLCLCTVVLLGTALAVSPQLRALLIPNHRVETVEIPEVPEEVHTKVEQEFESLTARYYKLDGELDAHEGMGSIIPVKKDGKTTFYCVNEAGELEKAKAPRRIQKELAYQGKTWSLDMEIYSGDIPVAVKGIRNYPMADEDYMVLGRKENQMWLPVFVDLRTWEIEDPMKNVDFEAAEDAVETRVTANRGYETILILSELKGERERGYYANAQTGEIVCLGEGAIGQWFLCQGKIYSYRNGMLCKMDDNQQMQPMFDGKECSYQSGEDYAICREGENLRVLDLNTGKEVVLEDCADTFSDPFVSSNRVGTKLSMANFELKDGLSTDAIAIVDLENGEMVTLERIPGMKESLCGWFDNEHFMIAGTIGEEWYICLYKV